MSKGVYILVGRVDCPFCSQAMGLLRDKGISVQYYSLNDSKWLLDLFKKAELNTVPQIWSTDGKYVGGYTELKEHLDNG